MKDLKRIGILILFLCSAVFFTSVAKADLWDKKTIITINNESLQIPRMTLSPGKYVLKLASSLSNRHIVQVWNEDETHLFTTILAIPNYRLQPTGKTEFVFWETPKGMPVALKAWFYPGDNFGQEFVYSKTEFARIQAAMHPVPVPAAETIKATEQAQAVSSQSETVSTEQTTSPATAGQSSEVATQPATATEQRAETAEQLPKTASPLPLVGLIGLLLLGAAAVVRFISGVVS